MSIELAIFSKKINWEGIQYLSDTFKGFKITIITPVKIESKIDGVSIIPDSNVLDREEFINYCSNKIIRSSWYYQQFLKYEYVIKSLHENILIIDGDSLVQRGVMSLNTIFSTRKKTHHKYSNFNNAVLGQVQFSKSYVTNQMVFNKNYLLKLIELIENKYRKPWKEVVINLAASNDHFSFSEYQLYGEFVVANHSAIVKYIKVFRRFDCISDSIKNGLKKYDVIAFEDHHKTGLLRKLRAKMYYFIGVPLG